MDKRSPFEAEHNSICAYPDVAILDFYKGYYDTVFIILSPFVKKQSGVLITWDTVAKLSGFNGINQLDIALRNDIRGLSKLHANDKDVEILKQICDKHDMFMPVEGCFPDEFKTFFLESFKEEGHEYIFVADEHGFERQIVYTQDVIDGKADVRLNILGHENWYSNKHEILYTTHWDSFFTLLCSDKNTVGRILLKHKFEGFYCNDKTTIYWSLQK